MTHLICLLLALASAEKPGDWTRVGPAEQAVIDAQKITLSTPQDSIAGALSSPIKLDGNALIVRAQVSNAPARGLTLALQDAKTGESAAYWQYPLEISDAAITAVMDIEGKPSEGRLFVGSDRIASTATISDVQANVSRKRLSIRTAVYGALVDSTHIAGQTFIATGRTLDAIVFRVKQLSAVDGPDLRVRVRAWDKGKAGDTLGEAILLRKLIPTPQNTAELDLAVAFDVKLERGKTYYVEWTATAQSTREQALLLYGGDDSYPRGCRYENDAAVEKWDLYLETYESN